MILLDTNVVSETMRAAPDPRVIAWLDAQAAETIFLSTISLAELLLGIAILPNGRRKADLQSVLTERATAMFGPRILPFDSSAAKAYASVMSRARTAGRPIGLADGLIAAVASARELIVATRATRPFEVAGVSVVNPWERRL